MMTMEQMKENTLEIVKKHLGDKFPALKVHFRTEIDVSGVQTEFLAVEDDRVMGVWISIDELAEKYQNGEDVEVFLKEKVEEFLADYEDLKEAYAFFDRVMEDFSVAREYLVPYVFDAKAGAAMLENHPYRRIGDIAMECHLICISGDVGMQMSINNDSIQKWDISGEELMDLMFARHQENVFLAGANDMEYCIENDKEPINLLIPGAKSGYETNYVLGCNSLYDFDAAFIFNDVIMKKVADVLKDDFYISPVCADNVVVTPVGLWKGADKMAELHANIRELAAGMEEYRTKLPEQLLMYSRELGKVIVVAEEEKGQMAG